MREKKKMKINVFIFFTLIILIISEPCDKTSITKAECTGNTTCAWTATKVCSGATACEAKNKESECTAESTGCTYNGNANPATCVVSGGSTACNNGFTNKDTCEKCQWVDSTTAGTCAVKPAEIANCATVVPLLILLIVLNAKLVKMDILYLLMLRNVIKLILILALF